jgi:hypothetical protein
MCCHRRWPSMQARHPAADAFLTGVLAVAVASPVHCPLHGCLARAGRHLARGRRRWPSLHCWAWGWHCRICWPAWCLGLPGPCHARAAGWTPCAGSWHFPMFATVVWLVWVLGQQSGINGAGALLALLVALALVVWTLGLAGRTRAVLASHAVGAGLCAVWPGASRRMWCGRTHDSTGSSLAAALAGLGTRPGGADHRTPGSRCSWISPPPGA